MADAAHERPRTAGARTKPSTGLRCRQAGRIAAVLVGLLLAAVATTPAGGGEPAVAETRWDWPIPVDPPAITGTFMEARQGGYHAGLDLRTGGRIGLPIRAPVDGWIQRVRTSPRGYGKALYLQTDDGSTLVFAHLSRFHAPVQELLRAAMEKSGRYEQDLWVERGAIAVQRGELIALSGDSGTGAPHLHLEVRDAAGRPQNPARWLAYPDTVAPRVHAVRLVPVDAQQQAAWPTPSIVVEAGAQPHVSVYGRFVVEVDARDATGYAPFTVAPRGVVLRVDGLEQYRIEQESFDFEHAGDIHLEVERDGDRRWLRLQRRSGSRVAGRSEGDAVIEVRDQPRRIEIEVYDSAGLRSVFRMRLEPAPLESRAPSSSDAAARIVVEQELVFVHAGNVALHATDESARHAQLLNAGSPVELVGRGARGIVDLANLRSGRLQLVDRADTLATVWIAVAGRPFGPLSVPGTRVRLADPQGDAAHRGGAMIVQALASREADGLVAVERLSTPLRMRRVAWAVREGLSVSAPVPNGARHVVWMQRSGRQWTALDTVTESRDATTDRWASTVVRDGGDLVLVEDRTDPVVTVPSAADRMLVERSTQGPHGLPRPRWPALEVPVTDRGAGIGDRSPTATLNGRPYPAVWDPEAESLVFDWFVDPGEGRHQLTVRATDRAGRSSAAEFTVELRPAR